VFTRLVGLDEARGCAVSGVHEMDVLGRTARRIDGKHRVRLLEDAWHRVDGVLLEEDQFSGANDAQF